MDILKSLGHPEEIYNLFKFKMGGCRTVMPKLDYSAAPLSVFKRTLAVSPRSAGPAPRAALPALSALLPAGRAGTRRAARPIGARYPQAALLCLSCQGSMSGSLRTCYRYLNETSRSFAAVIQALDGELRHAVCIFYLVLRALDTVEDDMSIPLEKKVPLLHDFHSFLYQAEWCFTESREKDRQVLEDFPTYCHYVAGLVGIGLSRLFSASQLEDPEVGRDTELANSMGLFLQKTNIIRDYLEDQREGRSFWPKEAWSQFAAQVEDLALPQNLESALACLNLLVTDALRHVPDVITYLSRLRNQSVFNFCAIPQVMAMATLSACYNNSQVFQGVVKIRKGQAVTLMMEATNMGAVQAIISQYSQEILQKVSQTDPSRDKTLLILERIREKAMPQDTLRSRAHHLSPVYLSAAMLLAALSWQYLTAAVGQSPNTTDMQGH
ncbi:squalene synthase-like [Scleropages formosus]|uniref:Squalene synthase n=1 Tax=Scleropages formosus TaxID=113540 RepID=A0A0P7WGP4_SCLFO|nr:squalene synthase-like [Scleropages formosus]